MAIYATEAVPGKAYLVRRVFTGSSETERHLSEWLTTANNVHDGVPRDTFKDDHMWKVMTEGRNGPNDRYPDSTALDDTGGFYEVRDDGLVYLTEKAKRCITLMIDDDPISLESPTTEDPSHLPRKSGTDIPARNDEFLFRAAGCCALASTENVKLFMEGKALPSWFVEGAFEKYRQQYPAEID